MPYMLHSIRTRISSLLDSLLHNRDNQQKEPETMPSSTLPYAYERAVAEAAVLRAAILTKKVQSSVREVSKEDKSPVTAADFAAQALLIAPLRALFPGDAFVGEEDSAQLRADEGLLSWVFDLVSSAAEVRVAGSDGEQETALASPADADDMLSMIDLGGRGTGGSKGRFWVMDPVDGTKTFLRGQQYAVSLALIEDGREVVGVLCCPNLRLQDGRVVEDSVDTDGLGIMLSAVRGQGVTVRHLSSSPVLPPAQPVARLQCPSDLKDLHIVDSRNSTALRHDIIQDVATRFGAQYPGTEVWSSHMRYASLIMGGADAQIRVPCSPTSKVCIWDHAGAQLIFTEIGGKVTDLDGRPIDFGVGRLLSGNRGMIVAREGVHDKILSAVTEMLKA